MEEKDSRNKRIELEDIDEAEVEIIFSDGGRGRYAKGIETWRVVEDIGGKELLREVVACRFAGEVYDVSKRLQRGGRLDFILKEDEEALDILRHSTAHIMAQAVVRLYPGTKYAIGPTIRDGFYYDFELEKRLTEEDLELISKEMQKIVQEGYRFSRREEGIEKAIKYFRRRGDNYKVEILSSLSERGIEEVSLYEQGEFTDLCKGPHIPSTRYLKAFKLTSVAGAYWRGISTNKMLQRIYGTAFFSKAELKEHLNMLLEAKERDHRKLGKELELFSFQEEAPGFPFWHEKGKIIYEELTKFIREENVKRGYREVETPVMLNSVLWHKSGHYDNFKENMYFTEIDEREYALKPMNCPAHCLIYKSRLRSYRELPYRLSEFGLVHRHELSGVLHGLFRVRNFTQDDAHIFCEQSQLGDEIEEILKYIQSAYNHLGFEGHKIYIATRPEKYIGTELEWENATNALVERLKGLGLAYKLKAGEGAFYGPKIEYNIKDILGREWQCGTVQIDFSMPKRLGVVYEGSDGKKHTPVMVHRAVLGSLERFIGILLEHYKGKLPYWLSPVQVKVLSILKKHKGYGEKVTKRLLDGGIRASFDDSNEKLGYKIRKGQLEKIPFMLILGDAEEAEEKVSVRSRDAGDKGRMGLKEFLEYIAGC